jgi:hypothetical protein
MTLEMSTAGLSQIRQWDTVRARGRTPFDLRAAKESWLSALAAAERFARERPPD